MSQAAGYCRVEYACLTDVGVRRSHNQDSYKELVASSDEQWLKHGHIFLVADGMGAHAVGELASKKAVEIIPHTFTKHAELGPAQALYRAFQEANREIFQLGNQNLGFSGMGTTATALVLHSSGAWIGHVGDTRVYRIRGGQVEQLTFDHSLRWEVARRRRQDPDKVTDIASNAIVRSLGPEPVVEVDVEGPHSVQSGDIYVLCSDGLSGLVSDAEIGAIASALTAREAAQFLVALANLRGGPDNITVIIVHVQDYRSPATIPKPSWRQRLAQAWNRLSLAERFGWASIPLALVCLLSLVAETEGHWKGWSLALAGASFVAAAVFLGLSWYFSQKAEPASEDSEAEDPANSCIRPGQVYRHSNCAPDKALFDRLLQVQRQLYELVHEAGWPYRAEEYHRLQQQGELLLKQDKLAEAYQTALRAVFVLAETARQHQQRQEVFLPNWNSE